MPKTKLDPEPKIDWPIAALLWRKQMLGLNWEDIETKAGMNKESLRRMVANKPSSEWPVYVLRKVLKEVGLNYMVYLRMVSEDNED